MTSKIKIKYSKQKISRLLDLGLIIVLVLAAFFRIAGLFWGEYQYLHPDERFLIWVGTDISPVQTLGDYFDTQNSTLNPNNRGHGFYVYGTLPMFAARYLAEWFFGHSGFLEMTQVGRGLSAFIDFLAVFLVFLVAEKLYDKRVGLLAAAFSAGAVLQVQQSHFFTMDTFANTFALLAFYFAVRVMTNLPRSLPNTSAKDLGLARQDVEETRKKEFPWWKSWVSDPLLLPSLGFGLALGMAVASKLNAAAVAIVLPTAVLIGLLKIEPDLRQKRALQAIVFLILAALTSLLVFRILQPYAFSGPGFLGIELNPQWVSNIREQRAQSNGSVDYPPAMQWARRPVWFSAKNLILWGLGIPLGMLSWVGFLGAGWRMSLGSKKHPGEWMQHSLLWFWTGFYFVWQSLSLNPTMRYQLPIYPMLTIFAAWAIVTLHDEAKNTQPGASKKPINWQKTFACVIGGIVLVSTYLYAYGFTAIYSQPTTRIEATRWIYQNIPGPVTLTIQSGDEKVNQPLPFPYSQRISPGGPHTLVFTPKASGNLTQIILPNVLDEQANNEVLTLNFTLQTVPPGKQPLSSLALTANFTPVEGEKPKAFTLDLDPPLKIDATQSYSLRMEIPGELSQVKIDGETGIRIQPGLGSLTSEPVELSFSPSTHVLGPNSTARFDFEAPVDGFLSHLSIEQITPLEGGKLPRLMTLTLTMPDDMSQSPKSDMSVTPNPSGEGYILALKPALPVYFGQTYVVDLSIKPEGGSVVLKGAGVAAEGDWDDNLPLRIDGYDGYAGIYPLDLTFNMYWEDNQEKLERFTRILDEADYITISSSRQWGSLPRIPERFPMTSAYYRLLLGCLGDQTVENCYNRAEPGGFEGQLGFELVKTFQSNPRIGNLSINDQPSEEAFTVYDHPKVFIFKKTNDYDPGKVRSLLGSVKFSEITKIPAMQTDPHPANLLLPDYLLDQQRSGGTWSEIFNSDALFNRYPWLGALLWYLSLSLLGWIAYPILRISLPGLADRGYPMARIAGLLILTYLVWLAGSFQIAFTRQAISLAILLMLFFSVFLVYRQGTGFFSDLHSQKKYILMVELLTLTFFLAFLLIRYGNPDLWHPWKGGEKPMDFSYFNAVLKSSIFPPYDPWYADGYLNYYYFGFVIAAVLVKWLGILPSVAYNLLLPTFFSMIAMGAFSIGWNLFQSTTSIQNHEPRGKSSALAFTSAISAAVGIAVLGNLGTVRMIYQGYQRLVAPDGVIEGAPFFTHLGWAIRGFWKVIQGANLPYSIGDWYWIPSRAIPAPGDIEPITEFPFFTVLYGDLHPHLMALPVTLLAIILFLGIVLGKATWSLKPGRLIWLVLAGLATGALRPTNTWDFPPYLVLGLVTIVYSLVRYFDPLQFIKRVKSQDNIPAWLQSILSRLAPGSLVLIASLLFGGLFVLLALLLFQPYVNWYALGYTKIKLWEGTHTPISSYLVHWGLFLFLIISWMTQESLQWMAETPASALRKIKPYRVWIQVVLSLLLVCILVLLWLEVNIAWLVLPLAAWAAILIIKPSMPDAKRAVLFLVGTGLILTLMVEVIVLVGDIGRMNTVFKFYLQVWTFFSISAAASLAWILQGMPRVSTGSQRAWQIALILLVSGAACYPILAGAAKIKDRMAISAPHSLDGMEYMQHAGYSDTWGTMDLNQDYQAIRWMQENVVGSPVIVEANLRNLYRWGSRFSIYTGLPGVAGWEWHQQQQRTVVPASWVTSRILEIDDFYKSTDWEAAKQFLMKYDVKYIILGQQERGHYPGPGLAKFTEAEGILWQEVFRFEDTVIYQVLDF